MAPVLGWEGAVSRNAYFPALGLCFEPFFSALR